MDDIHSPVVSVLRTVCHPNSTDMIHGVLLGRRGEFELDSITKSKQSYHCCIVMHHHRRSFSSVYKRERHK